jgi:Galactose oxidase, central domain
VKHNPVGKQGARHRATSWRFQYTGPVSFVIIGVMLLSGASGSVGGARPSAGAPATGGQDSVGASELAAASASLASGQGPAGGQSLTCSSALGTAQATCTATSPSVGTLTNQRWESEGSPQARAGAAMTYDGKDRYVVLFGGFNGSIFLNDSWEFFHGTWLQLSPADAPSARANASIAYDTHDQYVVLFGGYDGTNSLGDTWEFVAGQWTPLSPGVSPSTRKDATLSYDTRDGYLVLFGGHSGSGALGDTWTFRGGTWTVTTPSASPTARWGSTSTFDVADNYVLLFGGYDGTNFLGDTWEFATGQWTHLSPSFAPSARYQAGLVYDANDSYSVLFGGASHSGSGWTALGDTWTYAGSVWTLQRPSSAPAARQSATVAYSGADQDVVVVGGVVDGDPIAATDTWEYHTGSWVQILSQPEITWAQPAGRVGVATAYEPNLLSAVAFGGSTGYGPNGETWTFFGGPGAASLTWHEIFPSVSPAARSYAGMAYDAKDGYIVLFGGMDANGAALGDTWTFNGGVWTQVHPGTSPAARYGAMMAYDVADGYVVLFGGTNRASYFSDSWTFQGGIWSQLSRGTNPAPRAFGGLAWDNKTGYTLLFGGTSGGLALGDTWKFLNGAWTTLRPTGSPPAQWGMGFVADIKDNYVFMFGGCTAPSVNALSPSCPAADMQATSWDFRAGSWSVLATQNPETGRPAHPGAGFFIGAAFVGASKANYVLVFGGITTNGQLITDRWVYQSRTWNTWFALPIPVARYGEALTFDDLSERILMFGGIGPVGGGDLGFLDDTWMWDTGLWAGVNSTLNPSPRAFAPVVFFGTLPFVKGPTAANYTVLFGGFGPSGYLGDTWKWIGSPIGGQWRQLHPVTSPPVRANDSLTYDAADNEVVLFGGQDSGGYLGDTWVYSVSGAWTQIFPSAAPSARANAAMAYDSEDKYVVLFGGHNSGGALGDTWEFVGGVWTQLFPTNSPSARYGAGIVDCPTNSKASKGGQPQVVLLLGGTTGSKFLGDTWAFLGGQWTVVNDSAPSPVPAAFGGLGSDLDDGTPITFAGLAAGGPLPDFWDFRVP